MVMLWFIGLQRISIGISPANCFPVAACKYVEADGCYPGRKGTECHFGKDFPQYVFVWGVGFLGLIAGIERDEIKDWDEGFLF